MHYLIDLASRVLSITHGKKIVYLDYVFCSPYCGTLSTEVCSLNTQQNPR
jgi:hypothetical protein